MKTLSSSLKNKLQGSDSPLFKNFLLDNFAYKTVSLFVALVLWLAILGRRDFVSTKEVELLFTPAKGHMVMSQSADKIKVKISGSQSIIKKNRERFQSIMIDVSGMSDGNHEVDISNQNFDLPAGIRILSVRPNVVHIEISSQK